MIYPDFDADPLEPSSRWSEEAYLDLIAVDLEDSASIMSFVDVYGELGMRHGRAVSERTMLAGFALFHGQEQISESLMEGREEAFKAVGIHPASGETLDEFRWGAVCMRDFVAAWRAVQGELDPASHIWECPIWEYQHKVEEVPWRGDGAVTVLTAGLGEALECFGPSISATPTAPIYDDHWMFEICCLELFNHMVEQAAYRKCTNETCGRFFVRQRGRALHGQHRTRGVKYCSAGCAKMQASREYRRRKSASNP